MLSIIISQSYKNKSETNDKFAKKAMKKCHDNHPLCRQVAPCQKLSRVPNMVQMYDKNREMVKTKSRLNKRKWSVTC